MQVYRSRFGQLSGSDLAEVIGQARRIYHQVQKRTPRRVPYVRSRYFAKDKIFINTFWEHLNQKSPAERVRRLKFYVCALDVVRSTAYAPDTVYTHVNRDIGLHRFYAQTKDGSYFCVQVKENKRTGRKEFISVFPVKRPK